MLPANVMRGQALAGIQTCPQLGWHLGLQGGHQWAYFSYYITLHKYSYNVLGQVCRMKSEHTERINRPLLRS